MGSLGFEVDQQTVQEILNVYFARKRSGESYGHINTSEQPARERKADANPSARDDDTHPADSHRLHRDFEEIE